MKLDPLVIAPFFFFFSFLSPLESLFRPLVPLKDGESILPLTHAQIIPTLADISIEVIHLRAVNI